MMFVNTLISLCILVIRPLLGPATCRYFFTCTDFALAELKREPFYKAVPVIIKRVLLCNPFTR